MLEEQFTRLDQASKEVLADLPTTQQKALGALLIAEDEYEMPWLDARGISAALQSAGVALTAQQVGPALSHAKDMIATRKRGGVTEYRLMTAGRRVVEPALSRTALSVVYVEAGKPRTARQQLAALLAPLTGDVRISDPYYGVRSLDSLALITSATSVRFLTAKTSEKGDLGRAIADFRREHPSIDLRMSPTPSTMHDRYIVTADTLILVGHGLKDIGRAESFVIRLDAQVAEDLLADIRVSFDGRWASATPL